MLRLLLRRKSCVFLEWRCHILPSRIWSRPPSRFKTQHLSVCLPVSQSQIVSKPTWQSPLTALKTAVLCLFSCIIIWQRNVIVRTFFSNEHGCVFSVNTYKEAEWMCPRRYVWQWRLKLSGVSFGIFGDPPPQKGSQKWPDVLGLGFISECESPVWYFRDKSENDESDKALW